MGFWPASVNSSSAPAAGALDVRGSIHQPSAIGDQLLLRLLVTPHPALFTSF
jgi:hypothetical protein